MIIQCTKALLDKLEIQKSDLVSPEGYEQSPKSLMGWHANLVTIYRRKVMILMNNETRYPIVINRLLKKDLSNINAVIQEAIRVALRMEGIKEAIIEDYLASGEDITFSKTASRSMVAKLNNTVREIEMMSEYLDKDTTIQRYISLVVSRMIQLDGPKKGFYPRNKMIESLAMLNGLNVNQAAEQVFDIELYQLNIQLDLEGHHIWRRVLVPSSFSFRHLHNIIQTVFDWQNYHLHEFTVKRANNKPLKIVLDDDPETLEFTAFDNEEIVQERFVSLRDVFSKHSDVLYQYDFGDSWMHIITLEKKVQAHSLQVVFLEGNGERPPEDVGGEYGFNEYLRILGDATDPEHEDMKIWAASQKERIFTVEQTNQRLKNVIYNYYYI
ncbi:plasmid pRiA4b ORF-3 family protein [Solibacillus merdavium]|uniref:Plasmid pRiA4b ORF-3 family protein n=1 Tax=Solibacillus merdavium TaxID=2762218 RepID=A0ABR8XSE0_9BACL|nr:plasmid pRiA4b ORF-3 family protein [Solibacillus merdavium]MBD8034852.1 plasmid pRiA4b ORF-3 family protein [Solibacillus merdavium]